MKRVNSVSRVDRVAAAKDLNAAERARCLAELSEALDEADRLAASLGLAQAHGEDAMELLMRIAAARAQVEALRLGRPADALGGSDPKWSNLSLWPNDPAGRR